MEIKSEMELKFIAMLQEVNNVLHDNNNYALLEEIILSSRKDIDAVLESVSEVEDKSEKKE